MSRQFPTQPILPLLALFCLLLAHCTQAPETHSEVSPTSSVDAPQPATEHWSTERLRHRAQAHLDPSQRDTALFRQDIQTYRDYREAFAGFPLTISAFPVAEYDYAVASQDLEIQLAGQTFQGLAIGQFDHPDDSLPHLHLALLFNPRGQQAETSSFVQSRNYPYLTAQGYFHLPDHPFDWVYTHSPDGHATLLLNMKHFDLRFGQTILVQPLNQGAFTYTQIDDSPGNHPDLDSYAAALRENQEVREFLGAVLEEGE